MRVFISHSWDDKTLADSLDRDLGADIDVWVDINELMPGDVISDALEEAVKSVDYVLLLWSASAAKSKNVLDEIAMAERARTKIVPCLVDDTVLPPSLCGVLKVDVRDNYDVALMRLRTMLVSRMGVELGIGSDPALGTFRGFGGAGDFVWHRMAPEDKPHWQERMQERLKDVNTRGRELVDSLERANDAQSRFLSEIEAAQGNKARLEQILKDVTADPDIETRVKKLLGDLLAIDIAAASPSG